jgi:ZIP family zinc transporter
MPSPRGRRERCSARDPGRRRGLDHVDYLTLFAIATATAFATGLGAVPVFFLGSRTEVLKPALWGCTVGVMTLASILGLLKPAFEEGDELVVWTGLATGAAFLLLARKLLNRGDVHFGAVRGADARTVALVFGVLFVHSLPEGLAIGTAYASDRADLSAFVIVAIALQNVPEGTSVAIPMAQAGFGRLSQFWAAVATSTPQPVGALIAFALVEHVRRLLPFSFAFAAGAMLALVVWELAPEALAPGRWKAGVAGIAAGAALMAALWIVLGV